MSFLLRPNHACDAPSSIVSLDTETYEEPDPTNPNRRVLKLSLGVARHLRIEGGEETRRSVCEFRDAADFWEWLAGHLDRRRPLWLWMHNAGFDLTAVQFWSLLEAGVYRLEDKIGAAVGPRGDKGRPKGWVGLCCLDDPPTILTLKHRSGPKLIICDTMNWFPRQLADLGQLVGKPQLPMPGDQAEPEQLWERCRRDAEIVEAVAVGLGSWIVTNDAGRHRFTTAGQSMSYLRHGRLKEEINWGQSAEIKAQERQAYYAALRQCYFRGVVVEPKIGGRVNVQEGGETLPTLWEGPTYHLDLNSAYGAVMRCNRYPTKYLRTLRNEPVHAALSAVRECCAVAQVELDSPADVWPTRREQDVWWTTGKHECWLCGPELERALASGVVTAVHQLLLYRSGTPFTSFVEDLWSVRQRAAVDGRPLWAGLAKGMLAALHGKFAQMSYRWRTIKNQCPPVVYGHYGFDPGDGTGRQLRRAIGRLVQQREVRGEQEHSFPAIAAYCLSYARERMRQLIRAAGPFATLYVDTDSLHVTQAGYDALAAAGEVQPTQLGKLRVETCAKVAIYRGPQDYELDGEVTLSGLGRKAVQVGPTVWTQDQFTRLDSLLSGAPPEGPLVTRVYVTRPVHPIRGKVGSDGWVEPLDSRELPP